MVYFANCCRYFISQWKSKSVTRSGGVFHQVTSTTWPTPSNMKSDTFTGFMPGEEGEEREEREERDYKVKSSSRNGENSIIYYRKDG